MLVERSQMLMSFCSSESNEATDESGFNLYAYVCIKGIREVLTSIFSYYGSKNDNFLDVFGNLSSGERWGVNSEQKVKPLPDPTCTHWQEDPLSGPVGMHLWVDVSQQDPCVMADQSAVQK